MFGLIAPCTLGAPPAVFHESFAHRLAEASGFHLFMQVSTSRASWVSFVDHPPAVRKSCSNSHSLSSRMNLSGRAVAKVNLIACYEDRHVQLQAVWKR
mmetsp:Transcript_50722/g.100898  ORF Transcript_50722/g.100898 Transcript_50722/m.100898 type:complete len:98 (-) Transcript_50722:8-301(-)